MNRETEDNKKNCSLTVNCYKLNAWENDVIDKMLTTKDFSSSKKAKEESFSELNSVSITNVEHTQQFNSLQATSKLITSNVQALANHLLTANNTNDKILRELLDKKQNNDFSSYENIKTFYQKRASETVAENDDEGLLIENHKKIKLAHDSSDFDLLLADNTMNDQSASAANNLTI